MIFGYFIEGPLTSSLAAGLIFWLAGWVMKSYPPKWPNYFYGYRTMSSLKSKETFDAACKSTNGAIIGSAYIKALEHSDDVATTTKTFLEGVLK